MQKLLIGGTIFLLVACSKPEKIEQNDWSKDNLFGEVKKYLETQYKPLGDTKDGQGIQNNLGLLQKTSKSYTETGMVEEFVFSERGEKVRERFLFEYNANGKIIKKHRFVALDSLPTATNEFQYNEEGDLVEELNYELGALKTKTVYEWDKTANKRIGKIYNPEGVEYSVMHTSLDADENVLSESKFEREDQIVGYSLQKKYSPEGILQQVEHYQPVGNNFSITKFNAAEQVIQVLNYIEGIIANSCRYAYDEKGNQTEVHCDLYENQLKRTVSSTMKYDYDKENNWTKKVTYQEGIVTYVVERTYVYY